MVVDVGAGQGYLGRILARQFGLQVPSDHLQDVIGLIHLVANSQLLALWRVFERLYDMITR